MSGGKRPFVVMAKPVGSRCNMRCAYCYYLDKGKFSSHKKQSRMSLGLLEELIRQTIEASPGPVVSFVWHGGEPTLAGIEFYQRAVELQRKYLPEGWQAWNNLQTNGLLLNKKWCGFLRENRFDVGVSIDGSEAVHDANRRDLGGGPTYRRARQGIRLLREAGIRPDILCTVNSATIGDPEGVYGALEELGCEWVQFIPIVARTAGDGPSPGPLTPESVTPEGYGEFLCRVFDIWARRGLGRMDIQLFAEMAKVLAGGQASLCWMAPECGRALVVEEDGGVYSCDHFVDREHRLGDLSGEGLRALLDGPEQTAFGRDKREKLDPECRACRWYRYCGGGCPKDRYGGDGGPGRYYLCEGLKKFFAHGTPVLERIMEMSRQGMGPGRTMEYMQKGTQTEGEKR